MLNTAYSLKMQRSRGRLILLLCAIIFISRRSLKASPGLDALQHVVSFTDSAEETSSTASSAQPKVVAQNSTAWTNSAPFVYQEQAHGLGNADALAVESLNLTKQEHDQTRKPIEATSVEGFNSTWLNESYYSFTINGVSSLVRTRPSYAPIRPMSVVQKRIPAEFNHGSQEESIDRIYYINLEKRYSRRAVMDNWLSKQPIPYQRVSAIQGDPNVCIKRKQGLTCIGVSGLARSNLHIMDQLNTTGITLVLEDDIVINDMEKLLASVSLVPPDWDVLRWDCWDPPLPGFEHFNFSFKVNPINETSCKEKGVQKCWFCGGTHIVMWGEKAVNKLRKIWGTQPHNGIDCLLGAPQFAELSLKTYCINVGVGEFHTPLSEKSDIIKS